MKVTSSISCENWGDTFPYQVFKGKSKITSRFCNFLIQKFKDEWKNNGHLAEHRVLIDKTNDLEKPMLENVTLLYVSGSADGKTDFFLFAVDSLSVPEEVLFHTFPSLCSLRLNLSSTCRLSLMKEAAVLPFTSSPRLCLGLQQGGRQCRVWSQNAACNWHRVDMAGQRRYLLALSECLLLLRPLTRPQKPRALAPGHSCRAGTGWARAGH